VYQFQPGDYVYLQQIAPTTLDVTARRIILRVREVLGSGMLVLALIEKRVSINAKLT
jgi:hypothetical protein